MPQPLIQFKSVHKSFGDNHVLKGINLRINKGETTVIVGKSGEGKSVILKHIIGLLEPDSGTIMLEGRPLSEMKKRERRTFNRKSSFMFQSTALFDSMNAFDNIALPLRERTRMPESEIKEKAMNKMKQLDLHGIDNKYPAQLSGGMKKRVALARALITDPEIVLFDEPTTGLDPIRKNAVHSMISEYQEKFGFTGIVVSHDIPDVFYIAQHVAILNEGHVLFEGSPEEIRKVKDKTVRQFIQGFENRDDELTGLAHQIQVQEQFMAEMARLQRYKTEFSLIILTVENLNEINEKVGHVAGLSMLKNFAAQVQRFLRITDVSSRYSMNQIMLLLHNSNANQAKMAIEKLVRELKGYENTIIGEHGVSCPGLCFSVSVGFTEVQADSRMEEVVRNAESNRTMFYEFKVNKQMEES